MHTGLVYDGIYDTSRMNLYKCNNIYFPDESYYNSEPLPDVWIEVLDATYL